MKLNKKELLVVLLLSIIISSLIYKVYKDIPKPISNVDAPVVEIEKEPEVKDANKDKNFSQIIFSDVIMEDINGNKMTIHGNYIKLEDSLFGNHSWKFAFDKDSGLYDVFDLPDEQITELESYKSVKQVFPDGLYFSYDSVNNLGTLYSGSNVMRYFYY